MVTGWHGHVAVASKGPVQVYERTKGETTIRWCDYVILCGCFKILMKMNQSRHNATSVLTKFTELPFPVSDVYRDLFDANSTGARWSQACICLQLLILETGRLPRDLAMDIGKFKDKYRLWSRFRRFLDTWRYWETKWHSRANAGEVRICKMWCKLAGIVGGEYPGWVVA